MFINNKKTIYKNDVEILATEKNLVSFTSKISDSGVEADQEGIKIVPKGSLVDASGVVKNDATVVGILLNSVDVTNGPQPGAIIVEGYILKDRLPVAPEEAAIGALKKITFR
ncbi:hypothetical protein V6O07_05000 [Arthrospira platensis SPKY2]